MRRSRERAEAVAQARGLRPGAVPGSGPTEDDALVLEAVRQCWEAGEGEGAGGLAAPLSTGDAGLGVAAGLAVAGDSV